MKSAGIHRIKTTVSLTEFKRDPGKIVRIAKHLPVAILGRNKPEFYLFSIKAYEALLVLSSNSSLIETKKIRRDGKTIKIKI